MSRIAENHNVLYVFHPVLLRSAVKRNISIQQLKSFSMLSKIGPRLYGYTPFIIPFRHSISRLHRINIRISTILLKKYLRQLEFKEYILWFYDPEAVNYLDYLEPKLSCYDCVDEYSTMPDYASPLKKKNLLELENKLIKNCDLVFTTSMALYEEKKRLNKNTFLVENVGDFDHFNKVEKMHFDIPRDSPKISSPIIGFVGAMDHYKVDFALLEFMAERRPNWNIVLIGSQMNSAEKGRTYPRNSNIYYLGGKVYEELPNYMANFDVCIIPYKITDYTQRVFPIKLFEYLATGKPVISTALPALTKYDGIIKIAETYEAFVNAIDDTLNNDSPALKKTRLKIASRNSWKSRKDTLLDYIYSALNSPKNENRN